MLSPVRLVYNLRVKTTYNRCNLILWLPCSIQRRHHVCWVCSAGKWGSEDSCWDNEATGVGWFWSTSTLPCNSRQDPPSGRRNAGLLQNCMIWLYKEQLYLFVLILVHFLVVNFTWSIFLEWSACTMCSRHRSLGYSWWALKKVQKIWLGLLHFLRDANCNLFLNVYNTL